MYQRCPYLATLIIDMTLQTRIAARPPNVAKGLARGATFLRQRLRFVTEIQLIQESTPSKEWETMENFLEIWWMYPLVHMAIGSMNMHTLHYTTIHMLLVPVDGPTPLLLGGNELALWCSFCVRLSASLSLSIYISGTLVALYLPYPFINHCENEDLCQNWDHADFHWNFARILPRKQYSRVQVLHLLGLQVHTVHAWITKLVEDVTCICASLGQFHKAAHLASFRTFGCVWVCRCSKN